MQDTLEVTENISHDGTGDNLSHGEAKILDDSACCTVCFLHFNIQLRCMFFLDCICCKQP